MKSIKDVIREGRKTAQEIWDHDSEKLSIYKELSYNF